MQATPKSLDVKEIEPSEHNGSTKVISDDDQPLWVDWSSKEEQDAKRKWVFHTVANAPSMLTISIKTRFHPDAAASPRFLLPTSVKGQPNNADT